MKTSLMALVLLSAMACKTTEATSTPASSQELAASADSSAAKITGGQAVQYDSKLPAKEGDDVAATQGDESLLKWRVGRWSIVQGNDDTNEKMDKPGSVACDVTAAAVAKLLGSEKLAALKAAIAEAYKVKDKRQSNPIFRGLQNSRELVASYKGEEFLIEKMFQSREIITPESAATVSRDIPKASNVQAALDTIMEVATNPKICPTIPN